MVALYLQRAFLARRSYVTLAGKGARPQLDRSRRRALGRCSASALLVFIVAILLPYATLIAVSFSKSWGLDFWKGLTLANYKFILFDYDVTQRAIINSLMLAVARRHHRGAARRDDRLDRPAHAASRAAACSTTPR